MGGRLLGALLAHLSGSLVDLPAGRPVLASPGRNATLQYIREGVESAGGIQVVVDVETLRSAMEPEDAKGLVETLNSAAIAGLQFPVHGGLSETDNVPLNGNKRWATLLTRAESFLILGLPIALVESAVDAHSLVAGRLG